MFIEGNFMRWEYPKHISNTIDELIAEELEPPTKRIVQCKRCAMLFKQREIGQKFCCKECKDKHYGRLAAYKKDYGKDFTRWLDNQLI